MIGRWTPKKLARMIKNGDIQYGTEKSKVITVTPVRCKGCIYLQRKTDGKIRVMDRCYAYDREITDEMLDELCVFRVEYVWPPREAKE